MWENVGNCPFEDISICPMTKAPASAGAFLRSAGPTANAHVPCWWSLPDVFYPVRSCGVKITVVISEHPDGKNG